jgi:hypothetical protein
MSAVQAAPDKTVSVNVINTPDVNVANSPSVIITDDARPIRTLTGSIASTDGWVQVYQVPEGKRFVLSDIYFHQRTYGDFLNTVSLNRNGSGIACGIGSTTLMHTHVLGLERGERDQVFFPLQAGYEFNEGERVCLAQTGGGLIFFNLTGYETDL